MLMMRYVKKYFLKSVLNLFLRNFLECPRVLPLVSYSKNLSKLIPELLRHCVDIVFLGKCVGIFIV